MEEGGRGEREIFEVGAEFSRGCGNFRVALNVIWGKGRRVVRAYSLLPLTQYSQQNRPKKKIKEKNKPTISAEHPKAMIIVLA